MNDQLIPDGSYRVRGPGGLLTAGRGPGVSMWEPGGDPAQIWLVSSDAGAYTLRNAATGVFLGTDGDPGQHAMIVKGTAEPFAWTLSTGQDDDETTYVLTSAGDLVLSLSLLRLFPPLVAILPPADFSIVEWAFDPVE
jgi:hypothetical protein